MYVFMYVCMYVCMYVYIIHIYKYKRPLLLHRHYHSCVHFSWRTRLLPPPPPPSPPPPLLLLLLLTHIRDHLKLESLAKLKNTYIDKENRGACALTRAIMTSYNSKAEIRLQSWQLGLSLAKTPRLGPSSLVFV